MTSLRLEAVKGKLPQGIGLLRQEAGREGVRFLERLARDWEDGRVRFDGIGEVLLAAHIGHDLVGIGGMTRDPFEAEAMRMRRFYVRPGHRRCGIARRLACALLEEARLVCRIVTVNAGTEHATPFWEALGFQSDIRNGHTHLYRLPRQERVR